ncbi:MAG TPA: D-serine ammonia-lyase [Clostridia bacterium]|nr:D-serine ammonia-lyase [Clostridia bacterium]
MEKSVLGKGVSQWVEEFPVIGKLAEYKPVVWINNGLDRASNVLPELPLDLEAMEDAEKRLQRFAPLIVRLFPETKANNGLIESGLVPVDEMKAGLQSIYDQSFEGRLLLKCDNYLPVAGSIKARGGIYEVLKHAEELAAGNGMLSLDEDYSKLAEPEFREFFGKFSLAVGSTGNLGLSIGIMGSALGFKVTVHMSADAKEWKKKLLRSRGVKVIEYSSDYSKAVEEGRKQSEQDPNSYFVDDEHSRNLFLGYSVAANRLKKQLDAMDIKADKSHPLVVYLPCGVGGAPGGICFGLKHIFGDSVHIFFVEPTHSPCMLLGLATGENEKLAVQDFGLDNITDADGLAVGRPSGFVGKMVERLVSGVYTVEDKELYKLLAMMKDREDIKIEPSATPGLLGPLVLSGSSEGKDYIDNNGLKANMKNSTHIAWATGGLFVPEAMMQEFYDKGKRELGLSHR